MNKILKLISLNKLIVQSSACPTQALVAFAIAAAIFRLFLVDLSCSHYSLNLRIYYTNLEVI
jgi:hypothetical protein